MADQEITLTLTLPAEAIADPETFESLRSEAYRDRRDPVGLTALVESTSLVTGENLFDQFSGLLDQDDASIKALRQAEKRARRLAEALGSTEVLYDIVLSDDAEVKDVFRRDVLASDKDATRAQQSMAKRVPYGPKQNGSSFRWGARAPRHFRDQE